MFRDIYFYWKTMQKYRLRKRFYREPETWVKKSAEMKPIFRAQCLFFLHCFPRYCWQFYLLSMVNLILNLHLYLSNKNRKTHAYRSEKSTLCLFMHSQHPELAAYEYECIQCHMHCYTACDTVHPLSNVYSAVTVMPGSDMKCFPWPNTAETLR